MQPRYLSRFVITISREGPLVRHPGYIIGLSICCSSPCAWRFGSKQISNKDISKVLVMVVLSIRDGTFSGMILFCPNATPWIRNRNGLAMSIYPTTGSSHRSQFGETIGHGTALSCS